MKKKQIELKETGQGCRGKTSARNAEQFCKSNHVTNFSQKLIFNLTENR